MTSRLNPYLGFRGTARGALEFYRDVFGGELEVSTYGEGMGVDGPAADLVMHGQLETPAGYVLMVSDAPPGTEPATGSSISLSLSGGHADGDRLREHFARLSDGGQVSMPLAPQVWGDEFGMVTDRFGTAWMVNIAQDAG